MKVRSMNKLAISICLVLSVAAVEAQEIEEVLPEVVTTRDNGYKAVKYEKIVPLLIEAIKEQQQQINELKEKLNG